MKKLVVGLVAAFLAATPADADVTAKVVSVYDGDTFTIDTQYGMFAQLPNFKVRIKGIDTPERGTKAKCDFERRQAEIARIETLRLLNSSNNTIILKNLGHDRYGGRIDADVYLKDGRKLSDVLIKFGFARPYNGGKRQGWCQ